MAQAEVLTRVPKEFIKSLQGKDFILYGGLVDLATGMGLQSITTTIIQLGNDSNGNVFIVKATAVAVVGDIRREFDGYGDAGPLSVSKMILPHALRMSETRAKARALRDLTNVGMTAFEEMYEAEEVDRAVAADKPAKTPTREESLASAILALSNLGAQVHLPILKTNEQKDEFIGICRAAYVRINKLTKSGAALTAEDLTVG